MSEYLFKTDISKEMALFSEINPELQKSWRTYHDGVFKDGALSTYNILPILHKIQSKELKE